LSATQRRFVEGVLNELRAAAPDVPLPAAADLDRRAAAATISPREQELLQVLAEGLTNREIAARLVLEESTIRTHLRNIYRKLGVNSRLQAIQRAREIGLL
jgi:LuxR family maltose regulon positive regulatory protein